MKVDRRSFLSFLIGGAAGTALSPLPWKLTDDISIWTQMWPWVPIPEKGEVSYVTSACTLCPGGCGISVRKVDDRVVKIEGLAGHPINDGGLCTLGLAGAQLLYGPQRVKAPMKKVGGRLVEISWEEALGEIAARLKELRESGQPHRVACIAGTDRGTVPELLNRFLTVYGSPQFFRVPSIQDTYELTLYLMQGVRASAGFDFENADYVLSFGSGLLDGWGTPVNIFQAHSRWCERGGKLVQIEPRQSRTAAKADRWIPINPGTEGALALGLAGVIVKESLYNADFVNTQSSGFDSWQRVLLENYDTESAAKMTGVDPSTIAKLARDFAGARKPLAVCGRGKGQTPGSLKEVMAVHALNALVGGIGRQGGVRTVPEPDYIDWPEPEMDAVAAAGMQQGRVDQAGGSQYPHARYLLNRLPEAVNSSADSPIQVLFVSDANPCYSLPNSKAFADAFKKIPMVVSFSSYLGETAALADYILPSPSYLEQYEDRPIAAGYPRPIVNLTRPVVASLFNTRSVGDVVIELARSLGGTVAAAFPWDDHQTCLKETLGDKWAVLNDKGYWADEKFGSGGQPATFETKSSRFEFTNAEIEAMAGFAPVEPEGDKAAFPLVLVPYDTMQLWNGYIGDPPFVIKIVPDTVLKNNDVLIEVNPATASQLGLQDGQTAKLTTPHGTARVRVHLFEGIMPGVVALPTGLGHTAYGNFLAGKGVNVNALIGSIEDAATGYDAVWGIRAKIDKA
ncbi:MAG: molybdopterin-dependent oxidoreductase [Desulfobacterales bacterium]|jgi:anaerobic selenocysteine-containing dehydrogenase